MVQRTKPPEITSKCPLRRSKTAVKKKNEKKKNPSETEKEKPRGKFGEEWERNKSKDSRVGRVPGETDKPRGGTNENKDDTVFRGESSLFRKLARFVSLGDDNAEFPE